MTDVTRHALRPPEAGAPAITALTTPDDTAKAVVIYSGGMDSYTVLHRALSAGFEVHALSFHYGQRHSRELEAARRVCQQLEVTHQVVDIRAIHGLIGNSALTDTQRDMPGGDYDADNMAATVVPNRNMILLSLAIGHAINIGANVCFYGAHGGDHVLYPDCRPEFVTGVNAVAALADFNPVRIAAPYLYASKHEILADGVSMGLDYAQTWTCYLGGQRACGQCGSCRERLAAFAAQEMADPLDYAEPEVTS